MSLLDSINVCRVCRALIPHGRKVCSRSCHAKKARQGQLSWEQKVAEALVEEGWEIISPTACCDRIGIKDGRVYFLEFKPEGKASLRKFQKQVQESVPEMYRVVEGTGSGAIASILGMKRKWSRSKPDGCSSRFLGVSWSAGKKKWRARITTNGKSMFLGYFDTEDAAYVAYRDAQRFSV